MRLIALIIVVAALALESGPMRAEDIKVNKWPADVPYDAVQRNADGPYAQLKDLMMVAMPMPKKTYVKTRQKHARRSRNATASPVLCGNGNPPDEPDGRKFTRHKSGYQGESK